LHTAFDENAFLYENVSMENFTSNFTPMDALMGAGNGCTDASREEGWKREKNIRLTFSVAPYTRF
jgi:hypothetical protein